ncbi:hypothetical protein QC762_705760 [Podospora pseudocomata]|uniref:WSC domain-containing protein n=1 Tax=Podospora pseudocomata TaxID=2093779 RepID=A0ABR0G3C9_9PEZI|nr:hypothetical protein QC762_705760 [Podospora pseudocomata]
MHFTTILATMAVTVAAAKERRTFATLQHKGRGPLTTCRADPIVSPGGPSAHVHAVMGASNFGFNVTGESLRQSKCTTAKPKADMSSYWVPSLYFKDPETGLLEPVEFFYMVNYYFFDATDDDIKAFPLGLQIVSGNPTLRSKPSHVSDGALQLDPSKPIQAAQITCPRPNYNPPSWPDNSDGSRAGLGDPANKGAGYGFPFQNCDAYASPMRVDVHFPSCYNPAAGLTNYKNNMAFPTPVGNKLNCPKGWIHVPHMFFETYWNTPKFLPRYQHLLGKESPFVFSNGDATGFSAHGDFISGWDEEELQHIIDTCDAGHAGLHNCPGLKHGVNPDSESCNIECPIQEKIAGTLDKLPGNNPIAGWKYGGGNVSPAPAPAVPEPEPVVEKPELETPKSSSAPAIKVEPSTSAAPAPAPSSSSAAAPPPLSTTLVTVPAPAPTTVEEPPVVEKPEPTSEAVLPPAASPKVRIVYDTVTVWQTRTVYEAPAGPTQSAKSGAEISGFKAAGCYKDQSDRVISGKILPNIGQVSNTACVEYCSSKGFSVAGTEYGGECYCGNSLNIVEKLDDSKCNMTCKGDASQKCGGDWALTVFTKGGAAPAKAEKRHVRNHNHLAHHARIPSRHLHRR